MIAYFDRPSLIHALDPRVKIAWSVVVSLLAVILGHPLLLGTLFAIAILPWCLVRPPLARLRVLFVLVGTTVLGTMISQGFFYGLEPRTRVADCGARTVLVQRRADLRGRCVPPSAFGDGGWYASGVHHLPVRPDFSNDQAACSALVCLHADAGPAFPAGDDRTRQTYPGRPAVARRRREGSMCRLLAVFGSWSCPCWPCRYAVRSQVSSGGRGSRLFRQSHPSKDLCFTIADRTVMAGLVFLAARRCYGGLLRVWCRGTEMICPGFTSPPFSGCWRQSALSVVLGLRKRAFQPFTTLELATAAVLICLLHVAVIPWQIGLAKVPGLDALVFSIPYTAIFLLGLRLVPKTGFCDVADFWPRAFRATAWARHQPRLVAVLPVVRIGR